MHELAITERILGVVLRHAAGQNVSRVVRIRLQVGELSDLEDEWLQHYFNYLSRDTVAANAELAITRVPIVLRCEPCDVSFEVAKDQLGKAKCSGCGADRLELVSGRGYLIENMEVQ